MVIINSRTKMILLNECRMRCMSMTVQNIKALSRFALALLLFCAEVAAFSQGYSYDFGDTLRIYKDGNLVAEKEEYLVSNSRLALVWNEDRIYNCYFKRANLLVQGYDWAFANDYGVVLKKKSRFELFAPNERKRIIKTRAKFVIPLPFGNYALQTVSDDFDLKTEIVFKNNRRISVDGNVSCFDGGVVFFNEQKKVEIVTNSGISFEKEARDYVPSGSHICLLFGADLDCRKLEILDSDLNLAFEIDGDYEPATICFDGNIVLIHRPTGFFYLLELPQKRLTKIRSYRIKNRELFVE